MDQILSLGLNIDHIFDIIFENMLSASRVVQTCEKNREQASQYIYKISEINIYKQF